jgi:DNA-binding transcriptional MerR regulator
MAKKKQSLQQLDLFGMFEPSPAPEPQVQADTLPVIEEPTIELQEIQPPAELKAQEALLPIIEEQPETEYLPQAEAESLPIIEEPLTKQEAEYLAQAEPLHTTEEKIKEEDPTTVPEPQIQTEPLLAEATKQELASPTPEPSQMVFNDGKIGVKIKVKNPAAVTTPEPPKKVEPKENSIKKVVTTELKEKMATPNQHTINLRKRGRKSFKEMDAEVGLIEVPSDEILNKKLYYSIGEVAGFFKVNPSLIRAWENAFDILKPRKTRKGDRLFRVEDIKNLEIIYYLLRNRKFSIEGAKTYIKNNKKGADTNFQLTQSLKKFKGFLLELKANLAVH